MSGGNDNKGLTIGTAALGPLGALYGMQYDTQVQASKDANVAVNAEKDAINAEKAWMQKKKGINDKNSSMAALRLRGPENTKPTGTMTPSTGTTAQPLGLLGIQKTTQQLAQDATQFLNSPLGL